MSFDLATTVFRDAFAIERLDDRADYGEARFVLIGMAEDRSMVCVTYTERGERIRIVSARKATLHERDDYFQYRRGD